MKNAVLISVICPDDMGLVSAITGRLYDIGTNLGDTTFAVLGEGAEFTAVAKLPDELSIEEAREELISIPELKNATVEVKPFDLNPTHRETAHITHRITIRGGDRPGLIARLSEVFVNYDSNIVRLNSEAIPESGDNTYSIRISVYIPSGRASACLATVFNTASELGLKCEWRET